MGVRVCGTVLVTMLLLAGCGGDDPAVTATPGDEATTSAAAAPTATGDAEAAAADGAACERISSADLEQITGFELGEGEFEGEGCTWSSEEGDTVNIVISDMDAAGWPAAIEAIEGIYGNSEEIEGVGDDARFFDAGVVKQLAALRGDQMLIVTIGGMNADAEKARSQAIEIANRVW